MKNRALSCAKNGALIVTTIALTLGAFQNIATAQNNLNIVGTYPLQGQPFTETFVAYFDQALANPEENAPPSFSFEPPLNGRFTQGTHHIAFTPDSGTIIKRSNYKVTLSDSIRSLDGNILPQPGTQFTLPTHAVTFIDAMVEDYDPEKIILNLRFNEALRFRTIQPQSILVTDAADAEVQTKPIDQYKFRGIRLQVPAKAAFPLRITVQPGIKSHGMRHQTALPHTFAFPAAKPITVRSTRWHNSDEPGGHIQIRLSQPVASENLRKSLSLHDPETDQIVKYRIRTTNTSDRHTLHISSVAKDLARLIVKINKGLYSQNLHILPEALDIAVRRIPRRHAQRGPKARLTSGTITGATTAPMAWNSNSRSTK